MEWNDRQTVKKGLIGEKIVRNYLFEKGYLIYSPDHVGEMAHAVDFIGIKNKEKMIFAEVKTKPRMKKYCATGINERNAYEYLYLTQEYQIPLYLFFVDEFLGQIYFGEINSLMMPYESDLVYPNTSLANGLMLFPIEKMTKLIDLSDNQILQLGSLSTGSFSYN